jgi:fructose 1,6-bisphosphate aldolase/phosphatase
MALLKEVTISLIKADVGSIGGHTQPSLEMIQAAWKVIQKAVRDGILIDGFVTFVGDDIQLLMSHVRGADSDVIHNLARKAFESAGAVAEKQGLYGAFQDLLPTASSGNLKGAGPGVAELKFALLPSYRKAEAFVMLAADKCGPGAYNLPLYLTLCDPMHNGGLLLNPYLRDGFHVVVQDMSAQEDRKITLNLPDEYLNLAALLSNPDRFAIESVVSRAFPDEPMVASSVTRLHNIAGKYIGKDDPCMLFRVQGIFAAPEEVVEPWATIQQIVTGGARGSHTMPIMPVAAGTAVTGPYCLPLVSALGFSMDGAGKFSHSVVDLFGNPAWDAVRLKVQSKAHEHRQQGFVGVTMAGEAEIAYTGLQDVVNQLDTRFVTS